MKIDIKEIARMAGVSTATVSRSLNGKGPVRDVTRQKILQIAKELNYKPNSIARGLSRQKTDTIGVILPELVDEFFMDLIHSIDETAYKARRYVMISSSHSQRKMVETLLEFMNSGRVDGVVLTAPQVIDEDLVSIVAQSRCPLVLLNAPKILEGCIRFNIDNHQGALAIVTHLISHDYQKIGMIRGPQGNCDADERYKGFLDALNQHGRSVNDAFVVSGDFTLKGGYYGFMRLMSLPEKPEAVFCANDMMALGAYEAARAANLRIPQDVAIVGFDDIFLSRLLSPRLTTVHAPITELGETAVRYLLKLVAGEADPGAPHHEVLSTGLVIGGSCGCANSQARLLI